MGSLTDQEQVLMGATKSSHKKVTNMRGSSVIAAGTRVCNNSGEPSADLSDGEAIGVSLGNDLSKTGRTVVCRKGLRVPVLLDTGYDPSPGEQVAFIDGTGIARAFTGSGDTAVNAVFATGRIGGSGQNKGIAEDGSSVGVALIDFPGGL